MKRLLQDNSSSTSHYIVIIFLLFFALFNIQHANAQSFACGEQYLNDCNCTSTGMLVADSEPCNFNSAQSQSYILVDDVNAIINTDPDSDEIIDISTSGTFNNVVTGDYLVYFLSYNPQDQTFFDSQLQLGGDLDLLQALGNEGPAGTWTSNLPEFTLIASDLATVNAPSCNCSEISISDPCSCDNPLNFSNNGVNYVFETITINSASNQTWILDLGQSVGMYDFDGNILTGLQYATELSPGLYEYQFAHIPGIGYTAYFLNDVALQLSISSTGTACICEQEECVNTIECPQLQACTEAITPVLICPDYCIDGVFNIQTIETLYNCSIELFGNCFEYTPLPGMEFVGNDIIELTAINSQGICVESSVNVTIGACNNPPLAEDDFEATAGGPIVISVVDNDDDPDGDFVYICGAFGSPTNGLIEFINGQFIYTPNTGFTGADSFTYTICDGNGGQSNATVYITVEAAPEECENEDLHYCTEYMTPYIICPEFCLFENGAPYAVTSVHTTYDCSVNVLDDDCVRYMPLPGYYGQDMITIIACGTMPGSENVCDTVNVIIDVLDDCTPIPCNANQELCTGHMEAITFCVDFCDPNANITNANTVYNCSLNMLSANCIKYTPLPGYYGTDYIEIEGCSSPGVCENAVITIHVDDDCSQFGGGKTLNDINALCEVNMPKGFVPNSMGNSSQLILNNFNECFSNSNLRFAIYNMAGQQVFDTQYANTNVLWDANEYTHWPNGHYIYQLEIHDNINQITETGKIIIMK